MNVVSKRAKQEFRSFLERQKKPLTIKEIAVKLGMSTNTVARRLDALGRNVVQVLAPIEGELGRPAARFQVRR